MFEISGKPHKLTAKFGSFSWFANLGWHHGTYLEAMAMIGAFGKKRKDEKSLFILGSPR